MKNNTLFVIIVSIFIIFFVHSLDLEDNELKTILESPINQIESIYDDRVREILRGLKKQPEIVNPPKIITPTNPLNPSTPSNPTNTNCKQRYYKKKCKTSSVIILEQNITAGNSTGSHEKTLPATPVPVWGILIPIIVPIIAVFGSLGTLGGICVIGCVILCCTGLLICIIAAIVLLLRNRLQKKKTSFYNFYEKNKKINGLEDIKLMDIENQNENENFEKQFEENDDSLSDDGLKKEETPANEFENDNLVKVKEETIRKEENENEFENDSDNSNIKIESKLEDGKKFDFEEDTMLEEKKQEKKFQDEKIEFEENQSNEISVEKKQKDEMKNEFEDSSITIEKKEMLKEQDTEVEFEENVQYDEVKKAPEQIEEKMEFEED